MTLDSKAAEFWLKAVKQVGFPVVVASLLIWMGYGFGTRLLDSHERFINTAVETNRETVETQRDLADQTRDIARRQEETHSLTLESTLMLREMSGRKKLDSGE
jgi:hypothetical protein